MPMILTSFLSLVAMLLDMLARLLVPRKVIALRERPVTPSYTCELSHKDQYKGYKCKDRWVFMSTSDS